MPRSHRPASALAPSRRPASPRHRALAVQHSLVRPPGAGAAMQAQACRWCWVGCRLLVNCRGSWGVRSQQGARLWPASGAEQAAHRFKMQHRGGPEAQAQLRSATTQGALPCMAALLLVLSALHAARNPHAMQYGALCRCQWLQALTNCLGSTVASSTRAVSD